MGTKNRKRKKGQLGIEVDEQERVAAFSWKSDEKFRLFKAFKLPQILPLKRETECKNVSVVVGIHNAYTMQKEIHIDVRLNDFEVMHFLKSKSKDFFGHSSQDLLIDYDAVDDASSDSLTRIIRAVAAYDHIVKPVLKEYRRLKVKVKAIHLLSDGLARASHFLLSHHHETKYHAILHINRDHMLFCVADKGEVIYTQSDKVPRMMEPEAKEGSLQLDSPIENPVDIQRMGESAMRFLKYYRAMFPDSPVNKIFLCGPFNDLESIADRLAEASRISASVVSPSFLDPQTILSFDPNDLPDIARYFCAVGLCLQERS